MREQLELARQIADSALTVLIEGESGTGKELVAQFIHANSSRRQKPFIKINCGALAESLLESELFGHVKGSFTGALKDREGRFEIADGGTIFLDEVGEIPLASQVKLLRFLQEREFERVGESVTRKVDVRVIAATNRKLSDALREKTIREDFYYRLNQVKITLPPLRERSEDLLLLVQYFLKKHFPEREIEISPDALKMLLAISVARQRERSGKYSRTCRFTCQTERIDRNLSPAHGTPASRFGKRRVTFVGCDGTPAYRPCVEGRQGSGRSCPRSRN